MEKPAGACCSSSQVLMAVCGLCRVSSSASARPSTDLTRAVTTASARVWLLVSSRSRRWRGSIQIMMLRRCVKASGSRSRRASSLRSRLSLRPGVRPLSWVMRCTFSSTRCATTAAGSMRVSVCQHATQCPAMDSTNAPCSCPRGGHQPPDCSCVAPQGAKGAAVRAACSR